MIIATSSALMPEIAYPSVVEIFKGIVVWIFGSIAESAVDQNFPLVVG
jgi:hypothetical protein